MEKVNLERPPRYLTGFKEHLESLIVSLDDRHETLLRNYQNALKRNEQEKAKKYNERLDESEEELRAFREFVERLNEIFTLITKPGSEKTISEQLEILEFLRKIGPNH